MSVKKRCLIFDALFISILNSSNLYNILLFFYDVFKASFHLYCLTSLTSFFLLQLCLRSNHQMTNLLQYFLTIPFLGRSHLAHGSYTYSDKKRRNSQLKLIPYIGIRTKSKGFVSNCTTSHSYLEQLQKQKCENQTKETQELKFFCKFTSSCC